MNKLIDTFRQRTSGVSLAAISSPFLPTRLIVSALLMIYTDLMVLLIAQSGAYWLDRTQAVSSVPALQSLLAAGVFFYLLAALGYLLLIWFLLTVLTRSLALVVWLPVSFIHLSHSLLWLFGRLGWMDPITPTPFLLAILDGGSALLLGVMLVRFLLPTPPSSTTSRAIFQKLPALLTAMWSFALIAAVLVSAFGKHGGWVPLKPEHTPGPRFNAAIAIDPVRERVVLFGGTSEWLGGIFLYNNDTWEWDGQDWIEMHPKTVPPARAGHMMAYDAKRNVVVMFGGMEKGEDYVLSDTWEWDGTDWKIMNVDYYPDARRDGQLFYDPVRETVILSGGFYYDYDKVPTMIDNSWEWNGSEWRFLDQLSDRLLITDPNTVYDPIRKQNLLFDYNKVLVWENGQWLNSGIQTTFPPRLGVSAAMDPTNGNLLIVNGFNNGQFLEGTFLLENGVWKELHPDPSPSLRDSYVMFHDPVRNSFILYGGINVYAKDDMWELVIP